MLYPGRMRRQITESRALWAVSAVAGLAVVPCAIGLLRWRQDARPTSFALAVRGRIGAATFFPWRACLYAPLWVLERSISVYWALFWKVIGAGEPGRVAVNVGTRGDRIQLSGSSRSSDTNMTSRPSYRMHAL